MYVPGARTLRHLAYVGTEPVRLAAAQSGITPSIANVRRAMQRAYVESKRRERDGVSYAKSAIDWANLWSELSESSGYFFSQNLVSNESESLDAAIHLKALPAGLACLGVGPETMLSYLGLVETPLAFIVDIRRDNARLHCLYLGAFSLASSRTEWLSLLLARPYDKAEDKGPNASLRDVLASLTLNRPTARSFDEAHQRLMGALDRLPPFLLPFDRQAIRRIHRHFWRHGLETNFQQGGLRLRRYPTLTNLLGMLTPEGAPLGFLANEATFLRIQAIENAHGVIPVVGSLQGGVLLRVADQLRRRGLQLGAIYVSNIEQYLFENGQWDAWVAVLRSLPCHHDAILIRSFFQNEHGPVPEPPRSMLAQLRLTIAVTNHVRRNQGPLALHQMKTVVQSVKAFLERERIQPYTSYREVVCDRSIALGCSSPDIL